MARFPLTPEAERQLIAAVRSGVYPHIAALAVGLPRGVFKILMERGREQKHGRSRQLWLKVHEARAYARMRAEIEARNKDVKFWLRYGPGKTGAIAFSWSVVRKAGADHPGDPADWHALVAGLLDALTPFPEAKQAVLQALESAATEPNRD
jgi:hypothetical protein